MRVRGAMVLFFVFFVLVAGSAFGQQAIIVEANVEVVQTLAGHVTISGMELGSVRVTVEIRSKNWDMVIRSVETDSDGHFEFANPPKGEVFLQFWTKDRAQALIQRVKVRVKKHATDRELKVDLVIPT